MSLKAQPIAPVPEATAEAARAAFRKGNVYMQMRDTLGTFFTDDQFADLYPYDGQPAYAPWRLALISVMQFAENLSDRQAADESAEESRPAEGVSVGVGMGVGVSRISGGYNSSMAASQSKPSGWAISLNCEPG